jgi:hypothetical protein
MFARDEIVDGEPAIVVGQNRLFVVQLTLNSIGLLKCRKITCWVTSVNESLIQIAGGMRSGLHRLGASM